MSQNPQEITEAKLAAYIDGELAPEDRAEIEALLGRKPQYRPLLEELGRTRDLLRGLPRETAPAELAEMFNGQLERSVLLGADSDYPTSRSRIGAWHRVMAAAAILMLTIGLAAAVYFALPNHRIPLVANTSSSPMARNPAPTIPDGPIAKSSDRDTSDELENATSFSKSDRDARSDKPSDSVAEGRGFNAKGMGRASKTGSMGAPDATEANSALTDTDGLDALAQNVSQAPPVQDLLADRGVLNKAGPPATAPALPDNAVVMVVRASDLGQVHKEMAGYFASNNISWNAAPAHVELALNATIAQQNASLEQIAGRNSVQNSAGAASKLAASDKDSTSPYGLRARNAPSPAQAPNDASNAPMSVDNSAQRQEASTTRPASEPRNSQESVYQGQQVAPRQAVGNSAYTNSAYGNGVDSLYVARGLSRRQSRELLECLSRSGEVRQADVYRRADNSAYAAPTTVGNESNNATQQAVSGVANALGGGGGGNSSPGNMAASRRNAPADTQPAIGGGNVEKVGSAPAAPAKVPTPSGEVKSGPLTRPADLESYRSQSRHGEGARSPNSAATQAAHDRTFGRTEDNAVNSNAPRQQSATTDPPHAAAGIDTMHSAKSNPAAQAPRPESESFKNLPPASASAQSAEELQAAAEVPLDVVIVVQIDAAPPAENAAPGAAPAAPTTQPDNALETLPTTQSFAPPAVHQSEPAKR